MKNKILAFDLLPFYLFYAIVTLLVMHNAFFWDTVQLGSKHAFYYYEANLGFVLLPDRIDSGHIPAFGYLLALVWKIFGKTLPVSHLFMLPFLLGIVYQAKILLKKYFSPAYLPLVMMLFLFDPTLLGQSTLITPDIPLVFCFLLLLNAIFNEKPVLKIFAVTGLALVSMRGWMAAFLIFIFDCYILFEKEGTKDLIKRILSVFVAYLPGGIIAITYIILHYKVKGWFGYHEGSPWALCFAPVDLKGFVKNIFLLGWRLIDFGRIVFWIILMISVSKLKTSLKEDKGLKQLSVLALLFLCIFPLSLLFRKNLLGHRYLLPVYLVFVVFTLYLFLEKTHFKALFKKIVLYGALSLLLAGNLLIYPDKIAQGWDSSLAYLPYFKLRIEAKQYMQKNKISYKETGSDFPIRGGFKYIELKKSTKDFAVKDLKKNTFFLYSNLCNDISDEEYDVLHSKWGVQKDFKSMGIRLTLFRNPGISK